MQRAQSRGARRAPGPRRMLLVARGVSLHLCFFTCKVRLSLPRAIMKKCWRGWQTDSFLLVTQVAQLTPLPFDPEVYLLTAFKGGQGPPGGGALRGRKPWAWAGRAGGALWGCLCSFWGVSEMPVTIKSGACVFGTKEEDKASLRACVSCL